MTTDTEAREEAAQNYLKYRGKCKEMSEALCAADPTLRLVRGHYLDALWGEQEHWWCESQDGAVVDPTALQFPSAGRGVYREYDPTRPILCDQCEGETTDGEAIHHGRYAYCSDTCIMAAVT